jgi:hypothetical protein
MRSESRIHEKIIERENRNVTFGKAMVNDPW